MPNQKKYTFRSEDDYVVSGTMYEFKDTTAPLNDRSSNKKKARGRTSSYGSNKSHGSTTDDDGTGSLTYSATSSVASESSFANIMKVLEGHSSDSKEIASYLQRQNGGPSHHKRVLSNGGDEKSCAADSLAYSARSATSDSLAYSEEAESYMRMLAADGESMVMSHVSLLQGTALLSNGQSDQSSLGTSALGASYLNNGGGQRLDVTEDGNVFMMFSPAEHTESMKRRKERKRRERNEKRQAKKQAQDSPDPKTPERLKSVVETSSSSVEITPPQSNTRMESSSSKTVVASNPSPRSVQQIPVLESSKDHGSDLFLRQSVRGWNNEPQSTANPTTTILKSVPPTGAHRGSARIVIHETHPASQQSNWGTDRSSSSESMGGFCDNLPADDDDMWYSKWWSFCFHDGVKSTGKQ